MPDKIPPGQRWIDEPIVYDIGPVPALDLQNFRLRIAGEVEHPREFSWEEIFSLPKATVIADFHCVEGWSVASLRWEGVLAQTILELVRPKAGTSWVVARSRDGYSTNVAFPHFALPTTILAYRLGGADLPPEHGWPLRLVVPSLYAWKSAKYVTTLEFLREKRRGYWEERGYHDLGDPWREERRWR